MGAAAMAALIAVKQRGKGQPRTAPGTQNGACACDLTAVFTHLGLFHHMGAKAKLLKLKIFCFFRHVISPFLGR